MSEMNEAAPSSRKNPLLWVSLAVIGLIVFVFVSGDRGGPVPAGQPEAEVASITSDVITGDGTTGDGTTDEDITSGSIDRSLLLPPGMRARQYIEQIRDNGKPYPLAEIYARAQNYLQDGSLADAHLLYFFAAREQHLPAIMRMAEMSDPTLFRAEDSLLDHADVIQAYKWYREAATLGHEAAAERLDGLQQWAVVEAESGNPHARQLLLNFQ